MYKVLFLTQFAQIGGGETILLSLLKKLKRPKFEPVVILPQSGQLSRELEKLKIETHYLYLAPYTIRTLFFPGTSPLGIYKLFALVKKLQPDLIHLNHLTFAVYAGISAKLSSASRRIPVATTTHGPWDSFYFYQDIITNLFVDKILTNTLQTAQKLLARKIINSQKVAVVPFGVDPNFFKQPKSLKEKIFAKRHFNLPENDLIITVVGRLDPVKDHLSFLQSAKIIHGIYPKATFFIVGSKLGNFTGQKSSYLDSIKHYLKSNPGLARKVIFAGFIDNILRVYKATDILVSSSLSESFGLALAEGSSSGLPIVATGFGSQNLIVKNGENGFLVTPKRPDLLAEKIITLAKNPKLRTQFGKNGRQHIIKNFPIEKYVKSVENTYLTLLKNRHN